MQAVIGLGGNVGDVVATMCAALKMLDEDRESSVLSASSVYKTPPWGIEDQDWFFNACAIVETSLDAHAFLDRLLEIERAHGRVRDVRWGPRTLDLDVLIFGDQHIETERLNVPHPRMADRAFVMLPLADIFADYLLNGRPIRDLADQVDRDGIEVTKEAIWP